MKEEYEQSKLIKHGGKESMTHLTGKHRSAKTKAISRKMTEKEATKQALDIYHKTKGGQVIHGERY